MSAALLNPTSTKPEIHAAIGELVDAARDLGILAEDLAGGEHECGAAYIERHVGELHEALGALLAAVARTAGVPLRSRDLLCLQQTLIARCADNATAGMVDAALAAGPKVAPLRAIEGGRS